MLFMLKISDCVYMLLAGNTVPFTVIMSGIQWIVLDGCINGRCCPMFVSAYPIKGCK